MIVSLYYILRYAKWPPRRTNNYNVFVFFFYYFSLPVIIRDGHNLFHSHTQRLANVLRTYIKLHKTNENLKIPHKLCNREDA